jgi:hypothetical protein
VVSSSAVADPALVAACRITGETVSLRADVRAALAANRLHVAVIATGEVTTDIPEYADSTRGLPEHRLEPPARHRRHPRSAGGLGRRGEPALPAG